MKIITGHTGEPHVKSEHDRAAHQAIVGNGSYILETGDNLEAEIVSANEIRILDGVLSHQGCFGIIENGTYDALAIANGAQGMQRKDLIVCRYQKSGQIESLSLVVIQGTPSASNPAEPSYNTGTIADGDSPVDFPLYVVNISGISVAGVERLAEVRSIPGKFEAVDRKFENVEGEINGIRLNMGGVKIKAVRRTVTIPSGSNNMTETTINFASDLPNARLVGVDITIGDFHMPYSMNGTTVGTWISRLRAQSIVINNTVGAYNNYTMTALLFYVDTVV